MLVHEEADAVECPRSIQSPELLEPVGAHHAVLELRLRIRANDLPVDLEDTHGVRYDVEDRLQLRDAAREIGTQLLTIADVGADEQQTADIRR